MPESGRQNCNSVGFCFVKSDHSLYTLVSSSAADTQPKHQPLSKCSLTGAPSLSANRTAVLVQREMEKGRSPLVSIPPFGRGFSRHGVFRSDGGWAAQERVLTPPFIVSMSPPGYPSAWLRPRSACFRFSRQDHCSSATTCRFSTSGWPVIPPVPRPGQDQS